MLTNENLSLLKLLNVSQQLSYDDLQFIYSKFQHLQYFNTFIEKNLKGTQKDSLLSLCGKFKMEHFKGGEVIFQEGDKSNDKLYIVFNGKVALMKAKPKPSPLLTPDTQRLSLPYFQQLKKPAPLIAQKSVSPNSTGINFFKQLNYSKKFTEKLKVQITSSQTNEKIQITDQEIQNISNKYGDTIRLLKRGEGFGDRALLENVPRGLTACAYTQDVFLLILKKEDFDLIRQQFIQSLKDKKALIFTKFPVQGDYSSKMMEHLAYSFEVQQFLKGFVLTIDGLPKNTFYLIQQGDILLEKVINGQMTNVCILTKGQLLGEEIAANENGICEYNSVVLSTEASLMVIHKQDFSLKFPEECKQWVKNEYQRKLEFRISFQQKNLQSLQDVFTGKQSPIKSTIILKPKHRLIRSKIKDQEINIQDTMQQFSSIYNSKYYSSPEDDIQTGIFQNQVYVSPKTGYIPEYHSQYQNITLKSFQKKFLEKMIKKKLKLELIQQPPVTNRCASYSPAPFLSELQLKHKHTLSTAINSPATNNTPHNLTQKDIS